MDQFAHKTPVSWLHEICTRKNITPKYDLLQVEGAVHEPIFQYQLTLEFKGAVLQETGTGRSKKEAKHNTARAMLRAMGLGPQDVFAGPPGQPGIDPEEVRLGNDADLGGNPVGVLQELCMKMKFPPPTYEVHSEEGLPHERLFAIACKVGDQYVEIGKGKSKKLAKRMAAYHMAEKLRSLPTESANVHAFDDDDDRIIDRLREMMREKEEQALSGEIKSAKIGPTFSDVEKIAELYNTHIGLNGPVTDKLKDDTFIPPDAEVFVEELSEEHEFKAMYIEYDELSSTGEYQCLIQVTTEPPIVLIGVGDDKATARRNAANDLVEYFRFMILPL
ncbi:RISC-loading complex subunit TARBP2 [Orchesella cincta]|uniref:RISC-loading complex subunit TARBP2 n=1 Tax=Orchesella cincta TaxID=48709 RepID=A0A1D2NBM2_ORCCI|nr:RISC-loading complex subunit TARBP2 [Orchesella cincta]